MSVSTASLTESLENPVPAPAWKAELNAKLEAHRQRRGRMDVPTTGPDLEERSGMGKDAAAARTAAARVAARVAERYAQAPSYSEVLAARAAAAAAAAEAAAVAVEQAQVAAEELLSSLAGDRQSTDSTLVRGEDFDPGDERNQLQRAVLAVVTEEELDSARASAGGLWRGESRVEHPEPLPGRSAAPERAPGGGVTYGFVDAFEEAEVPAAMGLPAKLIEFPRELVAAQRARPRIAEGPLVEESLSPALRIFEVERESSTEGSTGGRKADGPALPAAEAGTPRLEIADTSARLRADGEARMPEWQSIRLSEHPGADRGEEPTLRHRGRVTEAATVSPVLHVASASDRAMAALVDAVVVGAGFLLFVLVFASCTTHPPVNRVALCCGAVVLGALAVFYQWLFLSYGGSTLGMRYAQIALCTFDDENPTRQMLRSRVWASVMAALPLGLGLVWAVFDEDSLGWHDRMTRTYQRSYR